MDEEALRALLTELVRRQIIPLEAVEHAADDCEVSGSEQAAHELRCLILRADSSRPSDWVKAKSDKRANERRSRLHQIDGGKIQDLR